MVKEYLRALSQRKIDTVNSVRIAHSLYQQQKEGRYCDLKVLVEKQQYLIHKCIIASASTELDKLIGDKDTIRLDGVTKYGFEKALEILYTGKTANTATIDLTKFREILCAADALNAESVTEYCCNERSDLVASVIDGTAVEDQQGLVLPTLLNRPDPEISALEPVITKSDEKQKQDGEDASVEGDSNSSESGRDSAESLYESIAADVEIGPGFCKALSVADHTLTPAELEDLLDRPAPQMREMSTVEGSKKTKCSRCNFVCASTATLRLHLKTHTTATSGARPYRCNACGMKFCFKISLLSHMKLHRLKKYVCAICGKDFKLKKKLQVHVKKSHAGDPVLDTPRSVDESGEPHQKRAKSSKQDIDDELLMELVLDMAQGRDGKYPCPICDKGFSKRWNLKCHVMKHSMVHKAAARLPREKDFECPVCGSAFATFSGLKKHNTFMHSKKPALPNAVVKPDKMHCESPSRPHNCTKCGLFFKTVNGLRKHDTHMHAKYEHTPDSKSTQKRIRRSLPLTPGAFSDHRHWCRLCGRGFKKPRNLKSHMELHNGSRYDCPICGCKFAQKDALNGHLWVHGGFSNASKSRDGSPSESVKKAVKMLADCDRSLDESENCSSSTKVFAEGDGSPGESAEQNECRGKSVERHNSTESSVERGTSSWRIQEYEGSPENVSKHGASSRRLLELDESSEKMVVVGESSGEPVECDRSLEKLKIFSQEAEVHENHEYSMASTVKLDDSVDTEI